MISSKLGFSRVRPLLGTYFKISLSQESTAEAQNILTSAFSEAARLEKIFSKFDSTSELNKLNSHSLNTQLSVPAELYFLLQQTKNLWIDSCGSFNPFNMSFTEFPLLFVGNNKVSKINEFSLDFAGIAKGYIVDQVVAHIQRHEPSLSGQVNAGGDLKFFNTENKMVTLRMGPPDRPLEREIHIKRNSIATSVPRTLANLRAELTPEHIISVCADSCFVADALTKVAMYAAPATTQLCNQKYLAQTFIFAPTGELTEHRGIN